MSKALELFLAARQPTPLLVRPGGNDEAWRLLNEAAAEWRLAKSYFYAGYAMDQAMDAAWNGVGARLNESIRICLGDYARCIDQAPLDSLEALAALYFFRIKLRYCEMTAEVARTAESLDRELAERLVVVFEDAPGAVAYAVHGICLATDMDGRWDAEFPGAVTTPGTRSMGARHAFSLPSAFALLKGLGDYRGMQALIDRFPGEFTTPGLLGWKLAVAGFLAPERSEEFFSQAADSFAADVPPTADELMVRGGWSGVNLHLWTKYFRARSVLARIPRQPTLATQMVLEAAAHLEGTESGLVNPQVSRLRVLVRALGALVAGGDVAKVRAASRELQSEQRVFGDHETDDATRLFLVAADIALVEFERDPATALASGRLSAALDALGRLPLIGRDVAEAVRPAAGQQALAALEGSVRTWIHRTLEAVDDEKVLQKLFYRLAQGGLPHLAQIRHGPQEYGKDVVVLAEHGGRNVLRMYQMKCGDLTMAAWRKVKDQLEEMFLVRLASINISKSIDQTVGVLVCNGHALPTVDPVMLGWFEEQKRDHGREFEFMHLDDLVGWIIRCRLVGEFRAALSELGVMIC